MKFDDDNNDPSIFDEPESPIIKVERGSLYGGVPGLDEEELAEPQELARLAFQKDWGPILALPDPFRHSGFRPDLDEDGNPEGAFASVDFAREQRPFDKARYKEDRLAEKLRYSLIGRDTAMDHVPSPAGFQVLSYLRRGIINDNHIVDENMRAVVRWDARVREQQEEIRSLREFRWNRRPQQDDQQDE
jgi:hypothetical protein